MLQYYYGGICHSKEVRTDEQVFLAETGGLYLPGCVFAADFFRCGTQLPSSRMPGLQTDRCLQAESGPGGSGTGDRLPARFGTSHFGCVRQSYGGRLYPGGLKGQTF